jgi:hypothetical protein
MSLQPAVTHFTVRRAHELLAADEFIEEACCQIPGSFAPSAHFRAVNALQPNMNALDPKRIHVLNYRHAFEWRNRIGSRSRGLGVIPTLSLQRLNILGGPTTIGLADGLEFRACQKLSVDVQIGSSAGSPHIVKRPFH